MSLKFTNRRLPAAETKWIGHNPRDEPPTRIGRNAPAPATRRSDVTTGPLRIANCSGFLGDRKTAARDMVTGGPIDVLTGDYLAELTMAILARKLRRTRAPATQSSSSSTSTECSGDASTTASRSSSTQVA
jgi:hypothetical protein